MADPAGLFRRGGSIGVSACATEGRLAGLEEGMPDASAKATNNLASA